MKFCIIPLFLLLSVTGSWATFLHPFMPFSLQPPQQQFSYPSPQRNIVQEQFLFFPQLRTHLPNPYQSLNYIQPERHPYHYFAPPIAPKFPLYPNYRESYSPVVQYIYRQAPLQPVQSNFDYGERVPEPALKDCNEVIEMQIEPAMVNKQPGEIIIKEIIQEEGTNPMNLQAKTEMVKSVQMVNRQSEETTSEKAAKEEFAKPMSSLSESEAIDSITTVNKQLVELTSEKVSEEKITNPMISSSEPEQTQQESLQQQQEENIAVEATEKTASDVTSTMDDNPFESTTLA